jgi:uncharacterized protein
MHRTRIAVAGTAAVTLAAIALAAPASAHVTVTAPGATRGGSDTTITFRVPTESAKASTVGLKVRFPVNTPIASVLVQPLPGWRFREKTVRLKTPIKTDDGDITQAVSEIDWHATSGRIEPGEFGAFTLIAGQLPDVASVTFKAIQLYSDGTRVAWTDVAAPGSDAEPEHPAPTLQLAPAGSESTARNLVSASGAASAGGSGDSTLSVVGIIVGSLGLVVAALALATARRRS